MNHQLLFLLVDEKPQMLLFICPICERQNNTAATTDLAHMHCRGCGSQIDCSHFELEILAGKKPADPPPRQIAAY